jgi:hypothetical protein
MRPLIFAVGILVHLAASRNPVVARDAASLCVASEQEVTSALESTPSQNVQSLDGRLGGSLESLITLYGTDGMFFQEGCSLLSTVSSQPAPDGSGEMVTIIDLWAARDGDIEAGTLDTPSGANWTTDEAMAIALQLLPADTVLEAPEHTEAENVLAPGFSDALASVTTADQYTYHGATGTPGDVEVLFGLSSDGTVWSVAVQLGGII